MWSLSRSSASDCMGVGTVSNTIGEGRNEDSNVQLRFQTTHSDDVDQSLFYGDKAWVHKCVNNTSILGRPPPLGMLVDSEIDLSQR